MNFRFSIITVCRNSAGTISRTINSVLSQRERSGNVEYIIIDGGSNDGTQAIVESYGTAIQQFLSEPDDGISDAFNKGIARASGEIVGLINSDDVLLPGALTKVNEFWLLNPEAEVIHGDILLYEGDRYIKKIKPPQRWWLPWRLVLFNHPATFVKKSVYEKHGVFDTKYRYAMDVNLFVRWIKSGVKIAYVPEPLVSMQAGGASGTFPFHAFAEKRRALISGGFSVVLTDLQFLGNAGVQLFVFLERSAVEFLNRCKRLRSRKQEIKRIPHGRDLL